MKKPFYFVTGLMLSLILSVSCEKENGNGPQFSGRLISNSDCKYQKSAPVSAETADTLSCIEYSFDTITHTLSLTHVNAGFNCCPEKIPLGCYHPVLKINNSTTKN